MSNKISIPLLSASGLTASNVHLKISKNKNDNVNKLLNSLTFY